MKKILSFFKFSFISLLVLIFLLIISLFTVRFLYQIKIKNLTKIDSSQGIEKEETVQLGHYSQKIYIRSENANNPVLLYLHGGVTAPALPLSRFFENKLVKHYTLVHWDRRGAGKSYNDIPLNSLRISDYVNDTKQLVKYLVYKFKKDKIYLLGLSFGSVIGLTAAFEQPNLFYAYIGVSQIVDFDKSELISYNYTLQKANEINNQKALDELHTIGKPPYDNYSEILIQRKWLKFFGGDSFGMKNYTGLKFLAFFSPDYSIGEIIKTVKGTRYEKNVLWNLMNRIDMFRNIKEVKIPVYFICGRKDYKIPSIYTKQYFDYLQAPEKQFFWCEKSGHAPNYEEHKYFQDILISLLKK